MRVIDKPLRPRDCADFLGFTSQWVRDAINTGVDVGGTRVKLVAEVVFLNGRANYRIYEQDFVVFLQAIGWKHLPRGGALRISVASSPLEVH